MSMRRCIVRRLAADEELPQALIYAIDARVSRKHEEQWSGSPE
jgi:hypothetical protein